MRQQTQQNNKQKNPTQNQNVAVFFFSVGEEH